MPGIGKPAGEIQAGGARGEGLGRCQIAVAGISDAVDGTHAEDVRGLRLKAGDRDGRRTGVRHGVLRECDAAVDRSFDRKIILVVRVIGPGHVDLAGGHRSRDQIAGGGRGSRLRRKEAVGDEAVRGSDENFSVDDAGHRELFHGAQGIAPVRRLGAGVKLLCVAGGVVGPELVCAWIEVPDNAVDQSPFEERVGVELGKPKVSLDSDVGVGEI